VGHSQDPITNKAWSSIDYQPVVSELLPTVLLPSLRRGLRALEIGCGSGAVSLFLASHGLSVLGIDINPKAIECGRERAKPAGDAGSVKFECADILEMSGLGRFDIVLLIRVLTCFPESSDRQRVLHLANDHVDKGGTIYLHDFVLTLENPIYADRYATGKYSGLGEGNFAVVEPSGKVLFVAHHHSRMEIDEIAKPYDTILLQHHKSLSMHGNACNMFEFVGRKRHW
jgi:SAM-dependent methyltransferase